MSDTFAAGKSVDAVQCDRRQFLRSGTALGLFLVAGTWVALTPAQAREKKFTAQVLTSSQIGACEQLGDALVPGAAVAGIAAYIDSQLAKGTDSLLMARYLGAPPNVQPGFYGAALDSAVSALDAAKGDVESVLDAMGSDSIEGWQGPPASFFSFLLRADALDVVYGTEKGFAELAIPYMAHIRPEERW
ncbi:Tat pathway signal sequence domain protein [Luminiphilus syltensis NOR5-1B]|uniref:Tat pathway signal sequence domain protein n=1 Tax=Luminiphilus syltensis NOR5-1B TaxID=565045 RepID=B8KTB2_9GAMM|nr:Tat pathway signal protein [Luminiphilus syltensis]EED36105.1 Tat pathway signal sequence domain protein [Luminiphilus syltensis NOR5-1B]